MNYGTLQLDSGASATNIFAVSGGEVTVAKGATVSGNFISSGGETVLGSATGVTVGDDGFLIVGAL